MADARLEPDALLRCLGALALERGDEGVVADATRGRAIADVRLPAGWRRVEAPAEMSDAHARNAGAAAAAAPFLLFVDPACRPGADLVARQRERAAATAGRSLVAGAVALARGRPRLTAPLRARTSALAATAATRYPDVLAANLLVPRATWRSLGGFLEGLAGVSARDFAWRALVRGWGVEHAADAVVWLAAPETLHAALGTVLRDAAADAWLARRWPGWHRPRPGAFPLAARVGAIRPARVPSAVRRTAQAGALPPIQVWCDQFPVVSETFVVNEARELRRLGHDLDVVATARPEEPALGVDDLRARYLEDFSAAERVIAAVAVCARHPLRLLADRRALRRWVAEESPQGFLALAPAIRALQRRRGGITHAHFAKGAALGALRASRFAGRPWSLTAHAYDIYKDPSNLEEKVRSAALVTSGCDYTVRDLKRIAGPDRAQRVHVVVMGVDPDAFRRRRSYPSARTVVAIGRLVEKKGFVHLIRAAAQPELRDLLDGLVIVGDGPLRDELLGERERLGLDGVVELAGRQEVAEVRATLERAALLAMPCVVAADGDRDSMPVVVKEAMAMEIPVIVSDEVGLPELVRTEFGRVVAPGSPTALAAGLAELLARPPAERAAMGRAARAFVVERANVRTETAKLSALLTAARAQR